MQHNVRSPHVLNAASNLMGICLIIQTSIKVLGYGAKSYIDELTAVDTCFFMVACLFSYLSIRSKQPIRGERLEGIADVAFLLGLVLLFVMVLLISLNQMQ